MRRGPQLGSSPSWPLRTRWENPGQARNSVREDVVVRANPWAIVDEMEDFDGRMTVEEITIPLFNASDANVQSTTGASTAFYKVTRSGVLLGVDFISKDLLAADNTNYLTFTLTNKLGSGSGSTAMLAATDVNTTKLTLGTGLTANVGRSLTINATAANLRISGGDVLQFSSTATGTLANVVHNIAVRIRIAVLPTTLSSIVARTAGTPFLGPVSGSTNGEVQFTLDATNEVQTAGFSYGDQVTIPAGSGPVCEMLVKVDVLPSTAERMVWGLASANNATLNSIVRNAWFRLEASGALLWETDDNTTDTDSQSTGITIAAGTYFLLTVDMSNPGSIKFFHNQNLVGTATAATAFSGDTNNLQPFAVVQKDSGTGVPGFRVDFLRRYWNRI